MLQEIMGTAEIKKEALIKEAREASARIKAGDYITQEDLEKEVENWLRKSFLFNGHQRLNRGLIASTTMLLKTQ